MVLAELRDLITAELGEEVVGVEVFEPKWREYGGVLGAVATALSWWRSRKSWFPRYGAIALTESELSLFAVDLTNDGWANPLFVGAWPRDAVQISRLDGQTTQLVAPGKEPAALTAVHANALGVALTD